MIWTLDCAENHLTYSNQRKEIEKLCENLNNISKFYFDNKSHRTLQALKTSVEIAFEELKFYKNCSKNLSKVSALEDFIKDILRNRLKSAHNQCLENVKLVEDNYPVEISLLNYMNITETNPFKLEIYIYTYEELDSGKYSLCAPGIQRWEDLKKELENSPETP